MKHIAAALASQGRGPDTELLHVTKNELNHLKGIAALHGKTLPVNPATGLHEASMFDNYLSVMTGGNLGGNYGKGFSWNPREHWTHIRDQGQTAAVLAGNYFVPGSSILTSQLTSKGSQEMLNSDWGKLGQLASGVAGGYANVAKAGAADAANAGAEGFVPTAGSGAATAADAGAEGAMSGSTSQAMMNGAPSSAMSTAPSGGMGIMSQAPSAGAMAPSAATTAVPAATTAASPGWMSQAGTWAAAHPWESMALGGIAYGAVAPKPEGPKPHDVYFAGQSTSDRTTNPYAQYQTAAGTPVSGEQQYFLNNRLGAYTQAPGQTVQRMAQGGILNLRPHRKSLDSRFISGAGDGMSDSVDAYIDGEGKRPREPIKVADGEYVVPADAVSHLGNGSSNAGSKKLDGMVSKIRKARTGKTAQAPQVKTGKYLPVK